MTTGTLDDWRTLHASPELVALASAADPGGAADLSRLRKSFPPNLVHAALQLAEARRKARVKFGDMAGTLWADPQGVEMASSLRAATHKAERMRRVLGRAEALDVCSGIGADAVAMAQAGLSVTGVDIDPVRAWMAAANAGTRTLAVDASDASILDRRIRLLHADPARRAAGAMRTRTFRLDDHAPPPHVLRSLIDRLSAQSVGASWGAAIKLGPGVDAADVAPFTDGYPCELEYLSERGRLTQCVVWIGALTLHGRSATLLGDERTTTLSGTPDLTQAIAELKRFIFEPDDGIERAGLLGELCRRTGLAMPHARAGLLSGDELLPAEHDLAPMLSTFERIDDLPWNIRRVRERLLSLDAGIVEVKTRGADVDADKLQAQLRGRGASSLVVFVVRFGDTVRAIIARRVPRSS